MVKITDQSTVREVHGVTALLVPSQINLILKSDLKEQERCITLDLPDPAEGSTADRRSSAGRPLKTRSGSHGYEDPDVHRHSRNSRTLLDGTGLSLGDGRPGEGPPGGLQHHHLFPGGQRSDGVAQHKPPGPQPDPAVANKNQLRGFY
ncbi:hypothetical protein EYF80_062528 [Liparis tanakae]|uniref:Uncharacterized protein n=1 Tax=Liparis tanakae TaxID=230148 RepID=A0A4Z2EF16_9TELE|nr:hypothetical protein EYF80_062528 [Liparis tanakae]